MRRLIVTSCLVTAALLVVSISRASDEAKKEDQKKQIEKAEQWERAAQNREWAAHTQQGGAEELLADALELFKKEYTSDSERTRSLNTAGDLQRMGGDLHGSSVMNFDMAVINWQRAAEVYGKLRDQERQRSAINRSEAARRDAIQACAKAADAYELAAESYTPENGDDSVKTAAVFEKAASWRENLAGRK